MPWEGRAGGRKCCHLPMMDEKEPATPLRAFCQQDQSAWFTCQARDVLKALADLRAALLLLPVSLFGTVSSSDGSLPPPYLLALGCVMHPHSLPLSPTPQATSLLTGVAQVTTSACPRRHRSAASGHRHHLPGSQWPPSLSARVTASPSPRSGDTAGATLARWLADLVYLVPQPALFWACSFLASAWPPPESAYSIDGHRGCRLVCLTAMVAVCPPLTTLYFTDWRVAASRPFSRMHPRAAPDFERFIARRAFCRRTPQCSSIEAATFRHARRRII